MIDKLIYLTPIFEVLLPYLTFEDLLTLHRVNKTFWQDIADYFLVTQQILTVLQRHNVNARNSTLGPQISNDALLKHLSYLINIADHKNKKFSVSFKIKILEGSLSREIKDVIRKIKNSNYEVNLLEEDAHGEEVNHYLLYFLAQLYFTKSAKHLSETNLLIALYLMTLIMKKRPQEEGLIFFAGLLCNFASYIDSPSNIKDKQLASFYGQCREINNSMILNWFKKKYPTSLGIGDDKILQVINQLFELVFVGCNQKYIKHKKPVLSGDWVSIFTFAQKIDCIINALSLTQFFSLEPAVIQKLIEADLKLLMQFLKNFKSPHIHIMQPLTIDILLSPMADVLLANTFFNVDMQLLIEKLNQTTMSVLIFMINNPQLCKNIITLDDAEKIYQANTSEIEEGIVLEKFQYFFQRIPRLELMPQQFVSDLDRILNSFESLSACDKPAGLHALEFVAKQGAMWILPYVEHISDLIFLDKKDLLLAFCNPHFKILAGLLLLEYKSVKAFNHVQLGEIYKLLLGCQKPDLILKFVGKEFLHNHKDIAKALIELVNKDSKFAVYFLRQCNEKFLVWLHSDTLLMQIFRLPCPILKAIRHGQLDIRDVVKDLKFYRSISGKSYFDRVLEHIGLEFLRQCYNFLLPSQEGKNFLDVLDQHFFRMEKISVHHYHLLSELFASCYQAGFFNDRELLSIINSQILDALFMADKKHALKNLTLPTVHYLMYKKTSKGFNYLMIYVNLPREDRNVILDQCAGDGNINLHKLSASILAAATANNSQDSSFFQPKKEDFADGDSPRTDRALLPIN